MNAVTASSAPAGVASTGAGTRVEALVDVAAISSNVRVCRT